MLTQLALSYLLPSPSNTICVKMRRAYISLYNAKTQGIVDTEVLPESIKIQQSDFFMIWL